MNVKILENCQFPPNLRKTSSFSFVSLCRFSPNLSEFIMVKIQVIMRILFINRRWAVQNVLTHLTEF